METLRGVFIFHIAAPLKPMYKILEADIAERVEAVGRKVKQFQPAELIEELIGSDTVLRYNIAKQGIYIELENYQFLKEKIVRL